jgi:hypothetical protein
MYFRHKDAFITTALSCLAFPSSCDSFIDMYLYRTYVCQNCLYYCNLRKLRCRAKVCLIANLYCPYVIFKPPIEYQREVQVTSYLYYVETKEWWPLLTDESCSNGDLWSTNERGPSLSGSLGLSCRYKRFFILPWLL